MTDETLRRSSAHVFVDDIAHPVLAGDDAHHLARVLRLRDGESVTCSDGRGRWRSCSWAAGGLTAIGDIIEVASPGVRLSVAIVPVKGDGTEDAVTKLVEVGLDEIVILAPVDHSVVRWDPDRAAAHMERLDRLVRTAAMQSRRVHLPMIRGPVPLAEVLSGDGVALADPGGDTAWDGVTGVVVGPEGGFSVSEVARASRTVSMGTSVLRAGTAAVAAGVRLVALHRG